ncbi:DUF6660 family protein [Chitinophaga barathri]|nr:DUF6660 family protein [Chitinophaga barathri]
MKALCFLLSIWIIFCSASPCADAYARGSAGDAAVVFHEHGEEDHQDVADLCSPFCACYCCAVTTTLPASTAFFSRPQPLAVIPDSYICPPVHDFTGVPWQPPRFS